MKSLLLLISLSLFSGYKIYSQGVGPDSTFGGGDGMVFNSLFFNKPSQANGMALQKDHKILVAGSTLAPDGNEHGFLARYNEDGSVDNTFNGIGNIILNIQEDCYAESIREQPDGKIIVVGGAEDSIGEMIWIMRFTTDGVPDNTFSGDGLITNNLGSTDTGAEAFGLQPDGKILIAGYVGGYAGNNYADSFYVARFLSNGELDHSFSDDGIVKTFIGESTADVNMLMLQPDGKIIIGGSAIFNGAEDFALARYNSNGTLDNTFSGDGIQHITFSNDDDEIQDGVIDPDGKIVVAGYAFNPATNENDYGIARFNPDGTLDNSFHGNGMALTYITERSDGAYCMLRQPDGKYVMAGMAHSDGQNGFALTFARVNPNGTLDNTFDGDGVYTLENEAGTESLIYDIALQSDGKIVGAGLFRTNPLNQVMLYRITTGLTTATNEVDRSINKMTLYPNPVAENMVLKYTLNKSENIQITICDLLGKAIDVLLGKVERSAGNHEEQLFIHKALVPGTYFVKIESETGINVIPIIKE